MCFCELTCKERTFLRWCLLCHYIDNVFTTLLYSIFFSWQTPSARGHEKYNFQRFWWRYEHWCCHSGKIPKICTQTSNSRSTRKSNDESIKIQLILALVIVIMNNTNRTEWSPIRSVIIRVIYKIRRPRSGSPICQSRVWLQTELDDTKSCYQLIITITIFGKKKHWWQTSPVETISKAKVKLSELSMIGCFNCPITTVQSDKWNIKHLMHQYVWGNCNGYDYENNSIEGRIF